MKLEWENGVAKWRGFTFRARSQTKDRSWRLKITNKNGDGVYEAAFIRVGTLLRYCSDFCDREENRRIREAAQRENDMEGRGNARKAAK